MATNTTYARKIQLVCCPDCGGCVAASTFPISEQFGDYARRFKIAGYTVTDLPIASVKITVCGCAKNKGANKH